ncbi:MAG: hypothetical protein HW408_436 [Actinobacteria bacterium]|nr:hypothetical protein [Actinomycetota bacterium]
MSRRKPQDRIFAAAVAGFLAMLLFAACGSKHFSVGSVPFPADKPVFADDRGQPTPGLPDSPEPYRLIVLDYAWCPPCADAWKALREASRDIPPGTVRAYRILFDRERLLGKEGTREIDPIQPATPRDAGTLPVTTVMALPDPFRKRFGPEHAPLLLLTDRRGTVLKKWTGASPSLAASIVAEVRRLSSSAPLPGR